MKLSTALALIASVAITVGEARDCKGPGLVGGVAAATGEFPFAALVEISTPVGIERCSGAIIGSRYVLTAAHCVKRARDEGRMIGISVKVGCDTINQCSQNITVERFELHPKYESTEKHDVALLRTSKIIETSPASGPNQVGIIQLPKCEHVDTDLRFLDPSPISIGWGHTGSNSDELQKLNVDLERLDTCISLGIQATDLDICALNSLRKKTCETDSGGPLVRKFRNGVYMLIGISAWGPTGSARHQSGLYHRVAMSYEWIQKTKTIMDIVSG